MKPLLLTLGEPAGIGPDCVLAAWQTRPQAFAQTVICAPPEWLTHRASLLGLEIPVQLLASPGEDLSGEGLACWNPLPADAVFEPVTCGRTDVRTAQAVIACIEAAAQACMDGRAAGMVTGPIEKAVLRQAGFAFPGHTEFLAHLAGNAAVVMMLASEELRVALLTTHMALRDVPAALTVADTVQSLQIVHADLQRHFGLAIPRIGLCALNPHGGEQGHFGREEIDILAPAATEARRLGLDVSGPLPADTMFSPSVRTSFDAIVCCYHDQGLIPLKALSFGQAVNVTLGLPFIRTSVDHGTALDLAGIGRVSCTSLLAAMRMAQAMAAAKAA